MTVEHIKYCKKCLHAYDISTNFDVCPKCRNPNLFRDKHRAERRSEKRMVKQDLEETNDEEAEDLDESDEDSDDEDD